MARLKVNNEEIIAGEFLALTAGSSYNPTESIKTAFETFLTGIESRAPSWQENAVKVFNLFQYIRALSHSLTKYRGRKINVTDPDVSMVEFIATPVEELDVIKRLSMIDDKDWSGLILQYRRAFTEYIAIINSDKIPCPSKLLS